MSEYDNRIMPAKVQSGIEPEWSVTLKYQDGAKMQVFVRASNAAQARVCAEHWAYSKGINCDMSKARVRRA